MFIVRIPAVLALLAVSSCSQTSPTPTPERTGGAEDKAVAAQPQPAPRKAESRRQQPGFAVGHGVEKAALPEAEEKAAPSEEGGGCQGPSEEGGGCQECAGEKASDKAEVAKEASARVKISVGTAPTVGPASAPVTLVVFSDFECPYCARAVDTLDALETRYGDELRIAFKNRPLPMHERAPQLARAALAANEQGRFWELHDLLFEGARTHQKVDVEKAAEQIGLDVRRFRSDLADPRLADRVEADNAEAARLDVRGTPTFFVNGRRVTGAQPVTVFRELIDEELRTAGRAIPAGK
ncbi:MAG: thioredoxin domain-containing protein [Polyangiaceae bacterium]